MTSTKPTNNLLRKLPTSSVVDGPPMFMKTIAVPFFEPVLCVTGATDALLLLHCALYAERAGVAVAVGATRLAARVKGVRRAIGECMKEKEGTSVERMYEKSSVARQPTLDNIARVKALANKGPLNAVMTIEAADRSYRRLVVAAAR